MSIKNVQITTNPKFLLKDRPLIRRNITPDRRRQEWLEKRILSICEKYKDGMSLRKIAGLHKISHESIRQILINQKICTDREYQQQKGERGRKRIDALGYVHIFVGIGQLGASKSGWILEHRLVMQTYLNRPLRYWEIIHHKDRNKQNNARENLEITTSAEHSTCLKCPYYEFYVEKTGNTKMPFNGLDKMVV